MADAKPEKENSDRVWPPPPAGPLWEPAADAEETYPPGCVVEALPDGSLRVAQAEEMRAREAIRHGIVAGMWNGSLLIAAVLISVSAGTWRVSQMWQGWHLIFPLSGLYLLLNALGVRYSQAEWIADTDSLTRRWQWRWQTHWRTRRYTGGELRLLRVADDEGDRCDLTYHCWRMRFGRGILWGGHLGRCTSEQLRRLGERVAEHTGWPLYLP